MFQQQNSHILSSSEIVKLLKAYQYQKTNPTSLSIRVVLMFPISDDDPSTSSCSNVDEDQRESERRSHFCSASQVTSHKYTQCPHNNQPTVKIDLNPVQGQKTKTNSLKRNKKVELFWSFTPQTNTAPSKFVKMSFSVNSGPRLLPLPRGFANFPAQLRHSGEDRQ